MNKVYLWVKKEPVLIISAICAVISMFFYGPSAEYIGYINFRVLCLLFSLMAVVAGFTKCGLFNVLAQKVVQKCHSTLSISIILRVSYGSCHTSQVCCYSLQNYYQYHILSLPCHFQY